MLLFFRLRGISLRVLAGLLLALGAPAGPAPAQTPPVSPTYRSRASDSLRADLRRATLPDSQRVLTLFSLEQEYYMNDDATALRIARQALALARRQGFARGELMLLSDLARICSSAEDLPQAERWAQELQRRALAAPPQLQRFRIVALQTLANVAVSQNNMPRALGYLRQSLPLLPLVANRPDSDFPLITYYGLSVGYTEMAVSQPPPADSVVRLARAYTRRFAGLARKLGRPDMLAEAYTSLGQLADAAGTDSAAHYLRQAIALSQQISSRNQEAYTRGVWAGMEQRHHRYPAAIAQARQAVALAQAVQAPGIEFESRDVLAAALAAAGQPAEAYRQALRARQLHDSTEKVNNQAGLQSLQVRFDTQRKEGQIKTLTQQQQLQQAQVRQQQQRLWMLGLGLAVVALGATAVAVLALRLRRSRALLAVQNEQLIQTRATQDRLYALVAHDLRSPVIAFAGLADLLNSYVKRQNTTGLASLGGHIRQAAQSLSELLDNLLNWALNQRGELTPQPRPLRATELLAEIANLYQNAADAAAVTLTVEAPADLLVQADANMTRTILRNLTGNALQATPSGGHVHLRASRHPDGISLQVADTGRGLTAETLAQLAASPPLHVASNGSGAGLGLLLSRNFAEAQGGHLVLANLADGTGTTATLILPPAHQTPQAA